MVQRRKKTNATDPVRADRSYSSLQLCHAANVSPLILRAAVRAGLKFTKVGGCRHYLGADWLDWLRQHRTEAPRKKGTKDGTNTRSADALADVLGQPNA